MLDDDKEEKRPVRKMKIEDVDASMSGLRAVLRGQTVLLDQIDPWFADLRARFNLEAVGFCCAEYISSELDCQTPGDRGLGRVSNAIPRLGGCFRRQLSKTTPEELSQLYGIMQDLMLRGYLTRALLLEAPPKKERLRSPQQLFEAWIPRIYSSDPSDMGPKLRNALGALTEPAFVNFKSFLDNHDIRSGGLFSSDKVQLIAMWYPLAAFALRSVEIRDIP
jgi:hypothetical protein